MRRIQKIGAIIMLGIFALPMAIYWFTYPVVQFNAKKLVKQAFKNAIPESELTYFLYTENTSNIKKINSHEIVVDGRFYDIIRSVTDDRGAHYWCISDEQETVMHQLLEQQTNDLVKSRKGPLAQKNESEKLAKKLFEGIKTIYLQPISLERVDNKIILQAMKCLPGYLSLVWQPPQ